MREIRSLRNGPEVRVPFGESCTVRKDSGACGTPLTGPSNGPLETERGVAAAGGRRLRHDTGSSGSEPASQFPHEVRRSNGRRISQTIRRSVHGSDRDSRRELLPGARPASPVPGRAQDDLSSASTTRETRGLDPPGDRRPNGRTSARRMVANSMVQEEKAGLCPQQEGDGSRAVAGLWAGEVTRRPLRQIRRDDRLPRRCRGVVCGGRQSPPYRRRADPVPTYF